MIDIHTHILPGIDDGSQSVKESISMLNMLAEQGVDTVVATPHFYIDQREPEEFLIRRREAAEALKEGLYGIEHRPQIALGAEVQFYSELYSLNRLEEFCISGTKYILVEMPFTKWTKHTYSALSYIYSERGVTPIIAHVERYMKIQKDDSMLEKLLDANAKIQINANFIISRLTSRRALGMVWDGLVSFLGSDCHNLTMRAPNIGKAARIIDKKLGSHGFRKLGYNEEKLMNSIITF